MPVKSSEVDLGPLVGTLSVLELDAESFYTNCLQKNSAVNDSTGGRVYTACHVLCRFIALHPELLKDKRVIEIGCGVGIGGISACRSTQLTHMTLTDGNESVISIAQQNLVNLGLSLADHSDRCGSNGDSCNGAVDTRETRATAMTYMWGEPSPGRFDVLIGSELCYYNTDMSLLVSTAQLLLAESEGGRGVFVHAHIFRKADQEEDMIRCFEEIHWITAEVPVRNIVSQQEIKEQSHAWGNVRCLVSGPRAVITSFLAAHPSTLPFRPVNPIDHESDSDADDEAAAFGVGNLFS